MTPEDMLARRRDRIIAIIMRIKESEVDTYLPPVARAQFRKVLLDQINDFADLAMDLVRVLERDDEIFNDLFLKRIEEIHRVTVLNGSK